MVTLNLTPSLHRRRDRAWFLAVSIIAATTSSLGALIWNASLGLDFTTGQRIRRSWLLGDLIILVFVAGPLLRWLGTPARRWLEHQFGVPPRYEVTYNKATGFAVLVLALLEVVFVTGIAELKTSLEILPGTVTGRGDLLEPWLVEIQFFFGLLVTALVLAAGTFATALARISDCQRNLARRDALTGCFNRRAFPVHGGFGEGPKFPTVPPLSLLLRHTYRSKDVTAQEKVLLQLRKMAAGGIYDHLGGGFHRYSVDGQWLIPHFEKMLYDNAQLVRIYLDGWRLTKEVRFRQVVEETLEWTRRELAHADGAFFAAQDADSEGEEGRFFVWDQAEILSVLGQELREIF